MRPKLPSCNDTRYDLLLPNTGCQEDTSLVKPLTIFHALCEGILELEPSMTWNPQVVAGMGAVTDPTQLHQDMHAYLAGVSCLMPAFNLQNHPCQEEACQAHACSYLHLRYATDLLHHLCIYVGFVHIRQAHNAIG